jgi:Serine dehydrogenase proteinase
VELSERRARYKAIETYRKRPLIVYATSTRTNVGAMMAGDAVREFIDQLDILPAEKREIDILVHSTGGDALTAWKLMSILRERFERVSVLVPFMAFSAATLFALGADEIVMHPHASLGPIDPQITIQQPGGGLRMFAYEDVGAFLRFLSDDAKIEEPEHVSIVDKLFSVVDPVNVGAAKRASELSASVGERLLLLHLKGKQGKLRAKQIAENLNKSFFVNSG